LEKCFIDGFSIKTDKKLKLLWNGILNDAQIKEYELIDNVEFIKQL